MACSCLSTKMGVPRSITARKAGAMHSRPFHSSSTYLQQCTKNSHSRTIVLRECRNRAGKAQSWQDHQG
jgi:hypothetical protein